MWKEGNTINIRVIGNYIYDAYDLRKIGKETDPPSTLSMWGWINHLRSKRWWDTKKEEIFIKLAKEIINGKARASF